jgi:sugar phosphate isomerase/epimerase
VTLPRLSLCPLTIIRASPREMVQAAAVGGFDAVGLRLIAPRPGDPVHPLGRSEDLRRLMADHGIRLFDIESCWLSPLTEPASIRPALEACAALGGRYLLAAGNDPVWSRMVGNFARVAELAAEFGLSVGLEPTSFCVIKTLDQAVDLLREAQAQNAGIILDPLHLFRAGETAASIAALDPRLIAYAQFCDARAKGADNAGRTDGGGARRPAAARRGNAAAACIP